MLMIYKVTNQFFPQMLWEPPHGIRCGKPWPIFQSNIVFTHNFKLLITYTYKYETESLQVGGKPDGHQRLVQYSYKMTFHSNSTYLDKIDEPTTLSLIVLSNKVGGGGTVTQSCRNLNISLPLEILENFFTTIFITFRL
jgi:hypothetical protein